MKDYWRSHVLSLCFVSQFLFTDKLLVLQWVCFADAARVE